MAERFGPSAIQKCAKEELQSDSRTQSEQVPIPPAVQQKTSYTSNDFIFGKVLGEGSFSTVYLAKDTHSKKEYAIKVCDKSHIIRENKVRYITREKTALNLLSKAPHIVKLFLTFHDDRSLYFVLTYARNGDLLQLIKRFIKFDLRMTRFYSSQIVMALESLKSNQILHRDLKPENILLDEHFNILLTDFGSCKILNTEENNREPNRKNSFVGTANYLCPEVLKDTDSKDIKTPLDHTCDLWSLGCIIFQMLTGSLCFQAGSDYLIFLKIKNVEFEYPTDFPNEARDLIDNLLRLEPQERLGAKDLTFYTEIRDHSFFNGTNWDLLGLSPVLNLDTEEENENCFEKAQPGLGKNEMARLMGLHMHSEEDVQPVVAKKNMCDLSEAEIEKRLAEQQTNKYNDLIEGNLILRQGFLEKKKGLIPRRRMFIITLGPRIYYIEPNTMVLKGQIPWTEQLKVDVKNFKKFDIITPNRIYNLEDPEGFALEWRQDIQEIHKFYFK